MTTYAYMASAFYSQVTNNPLETIKMITKQQNINAFINGFFAEIVGDIGRYASLVYGVSQIVGNDPHFDKVVWAGFAYGAASFFSKLGDTVKTGAIVRGRLYNLEEKLEAKDD